MPILSERQLSAIRVAGRATPPEHNVNPTVTRVVRMYQVYDGTAVNVSITPSSVTGQDGLDYLGAPTARYSEMRLQKVEAWFSLDKPGATPVSLDLHDPYSNMDFTDVLSPGVDFAHVCYRTTLTQRMDHLTVGTSSQIVGINIPASTGATGQVVIDLTVSFN